MFAFLVPCFRDSKADRRGLTARGRERSHDFNMQQVINLYCVIMYVDCNL